MTAVQLSDQSHLVTTNVPMFKHALVTNVKHKDAFRFETERIQAILREKHVEPQTFLLINTAQEPSVPIWSEWSGGRLSEEGFIVRLKPRHIRRLNRQINKLKKMKKEWIAL